jgi:RES domain-containing protein
MEALSGEGARIFGGRWNYPGTSAVYVSEHLSLAALEFFVRLNLDDFEETFAAIPIDIPDSIKVNRLELRSLPNNWRNIPPDRSTQDIGDTWLQKAETAVLAVPSVIVPFEFNMVLNPNHYDFKKLRIEKTHNFSYDPRLWKT